MTSVSEISETVRGAEIEPFIAMSDPGDCIFGNFRIAGVCNGPTERLCQGPPECIKID